MTDLGSGPKGTPGVEPDDEEELIVLLVRAAKALIDRLRSEVAEGPSSPLTVVHGLAARYLSGREDVTAAELAQHLGITKQSTSEVVATLERAGVVRRAPHPSDGRARVVLLTEAGYEKLADGRERWQHLEAEWAELVGRDRLDVVRSALEALLTYSSAAATAAPVTAALR